MRLIDADKMIPNGLENNTLTIESRELIESPETQISLLFKDVNEFINSQPTVNARLNVVGKWKPIEHLVGDHIIFTRKCSICGHEQEHISNFCPNCGTDMRRQ